MVLFDELRNWMIKLHNLETGVWKMNVLQKLAKRVKPTSAMSKNINGSWQKTGSTGLPEGSNGIDSLKPGTGHISGATAYRGAVEQDGASLYRSGTRDKAKSWVC
jgi:hypothetical protein